MYKIYIYMYIYINIYDKTISITIYYEPYTMLCVHNRNAIRPRWPVDAITSMCVVCVYFAITRSSARAVWQQVVGETIGSETIRSERRGGGDLNKT